MGVEQRLPAERRLAGRLQSDHDDEFHDAADRPWPREVGTPMGILAT
jgi:hypothetical protein